MQSLNLPIASLIVAPFACAAVSSVVGIKLAYWRIHGRNTAWSAMDALLLVPALLPAMPLAAVLKGCLGGWIATPAFWPIVATMVVSLPFAYLPARIVFARIDRDLTAASRGLGIFERAFRVFLPAAWPVLLISVLLTLARTFRAFATEVLAPLPSVLLVAVPSIAAACLIARELSRSQPKS